MQRVAWVALLAVLSLAAPIITGEDGGGQERSDGGQPVAQPDEGQAAEADPNLVMLDHVERVFELLATHPRGCKQAVDRAVEYVQAHKQELETLRRRATEREQSLCPKAKKRASTKARKRAEGQGERLGPLMFALYKSCPDREIKRLQRDALQYLGAKCKQDESGQRP